MLRFYDLEIGGRPTVAAHTLIPGEQAAALGVLAAFADPEVGEVETFSETGGWAIQPVDPDLDPTVVHDKLSSVPDATVIPVDLDPDRLQASVRRYLGWNIANELFPRNPNLPDAVAVHVDDSQGRPDWAWGGGKYGHEPRK